MSSRPEEEYYVCPKCNAAMSDCYAIYTGYRDVTVKHKCEFDPSDPKKPGHGDYVDSDDGDIGETDFQNFECSQCNKAFNSFADITPDEDDEEEAEEEEEAEPPPPEEGPNSGIAPNDDYILSRIIARNPGTDAKEVRAALQTLATLSSPRITTEIHQQISTALNQFEVDPDGAIAVYKEIVQNV